MPAKAKLTTRERSTSNVSADNLNKGTELTFAEADSNFINLRDLTIAISDGATTTDIEAGETITFSGATVSGNTVTITGGNSLGNLEIAGADLQEIQGTVSNADIKINPQGTGVIIADGPFYVNQPGDSGAQLGSYMRVTASGTDFNHEGRVSQNVFAIYGSQGQSDYYTTPFQIVGNQVYGPPNWPDSDSTVKINGQAFPQVPGNPGQILTTNGADAGGGTTWSTPSTNITFVGDDSTGSTITSGETFKIAGTQNITTAVSNDILTITGPDLTNLAERSNLITVVGDDSTGTTLNYSETFKIAGSGSATTAVTGDTLTISVPTFDNLITVVGDDSTGVSLNKGETLKIAGGANCDTAVSGDTLTISVSANSTFSYNSIATPTTGTPFRTIAPNFNDGIMQRCVLGNQPADQDVQLNAPTNMAQGDRMYLMIKGDYSVHNVYIYGMFNVNGVGAIEIADNKFRLFSIYYTGTEYICDVSDQLAAGST